MPWQPGTAVRRCLGQRHLGDHSRLAMLSRAQLFSHDVFLHCKHAQKRVQDWWHKLGLSLLRTGRHAHSCTSADPGGRGWPDGHAPHARVPSAFHCMHTLMLAFAAWPCCAHGTAAVHTREQHVPPSCMPTHQRHLADRQTHSPPVIVYPAVGICGEASWTAMTG